MAEHAKVGAGDVRVALLCASVAQRERDEMLPEIVAYCLPSISKLIRASGNHGGRSVRSQ
jgi:hypothetical protein